MMPPPIPTVLRGYIDAWNAPSPDARLSLLYQSVADDVRYIDPHAPAPADGRVALAAILDAFRARHTHRFEPTAAPQHHHGVARMPWRLADQAGVLSTGLLVARAAPDGRLDWIVHFVDA